jgi:hypothetical protein
MNGLIGIFTGMAIITLAAGGSIGAESRRNDPRKLSVFVFEIAVGLFLMGVMVGTGFAYLDGGPLS